MTIEVKTFNAIEPAFDLARQVGELHILVEEMRLQTYTLQQAHLIACQEKSLHPNYSQGLVDINEYFYQVDANTYISRNQKFMVDLPGLIEDLQKIKLDALAKKHALEFIGMSNQIKVRGLK